MNKTVKFELAKLLKEKEWKIPTLNLYFDDGESKENAVGLTTGMDYGSEFYVEFSELIENWNDGWLTKKNGDRCFGCSKSKGYFETFSAPTIAEVVIWLYEKHEIWIGVQPNEPYVDDDWRFIIFKDLKNNNSLEGYNSPTEAYEAAIEYVLNKIV
jgi:hypothetical protein